jgi:7,8-dihydropterin-6-yl-methyl-4-(beta-D-ribofuranosyl)aminobenzene 5'-phosphate synthase
VSYTANCKITCLVNNTAAPGYKAEHGISFHIESSCLRMLYDTGQSGDVLLHNAKVAGLDFGWLGLILLSHGHYDHTGGLLKALEKSGTIKLMALEPAFNQKFVLKDGKLKDISMPFDAKTLWKHCDIILQQGPYTICGGLWATGEIPRVTPFETPDSRFMEAHRGAMSPDHLQDDQSIVVDTGDGLMLICGCCHSGIVNTILQVKVLFGRYPTTIVGGLHMESATDTKINATVEALKEAGVKRAILGHCSGTKIMDALRQAGVEVVQLEAGMRIL